MNLAEVQKAVSRVLGKHEGVLVDLSAKQSALLELAAFTGMVEHYKSQGSEAELINPKGKPGLSVKTSTRGDPWNFSRFHITGDHPPVDLHMNLKVRSAYDAGIYCIDLGVVVESSIPDTKPQGGNWECLDNSQLITFGEVKKLNIYPMLLAQFIGIVHELTPRFLNGISADTPHLPPVLMSLGHFSANAQTIVESYKNRKIFVTIAENYDSRLSYVSPSSGGSPFLASTW